MRTPSFLVIGAAKCGTTSLCTVLGQHPEVFMSDPKEPHFFSRITTFERRRPWYESLFEGAESYRTVGEGSTSYTHPHRIHFVAPRIREELPDARLIYMVRHPVRRLESDWKMRLREGRAPDSVTEAVDRQVSLLTFGLYWKHLSVYRHHFPDDQILVVFLEDFAADPVAEVARVFRHIDVDPDFVPEDPGQRRNASRDFRRDGVLASFARNLPGFQKARKLLPRPVLERLARLVTEPYEHRVEWEADALRAVTDHFEQDARKFLDHCGKAADFWVLD